LEIAMSCHPKHLIFIFSWACVQAVAAGLSLADAIKMWEQSKDRKGFEKYSEEFANFNNARHLDEKNGCYQLSPGPVTLYMIFKPGPRGEFAVIEQVLVDAENAKSQCFKKTYTGVPVKTPPFFPFAIRMEMGG